MSLYYKTAVVFIFAVASSLHAQKSNLEIFTEMVKAIYSEEFSGINFEDKAVIVLAESQDSNDFRKILNAQVKNWCLEKEYDLYTSRFSVPEQLQNFIYLFEFTPVQNNVVYQEKKDELNGNVLRSVHVQLVMKIEKSSKVLYNKQIAKDYSDNVSGDQLNKIETDFFTFTKGKRSQRLISRLFEPALVSVAAGTIIYLFYSFRSN